MDLKQLLEKRAETGKALEAIRAKEPLSAEDEGNWDKAFAEFGSLTKQIERAQRGDEIAGVLAARAGDSAGAGLIGRDNLDGAAAREGREEDPEFREQNTLRADRASAQDVALALQGWMRMQNGMEVSQRHLDAANRAAVNIRKGFIDLPLVRDYRSVVAQKRALSTSAGSGGDTIPAGFVNNFEHALLAFNDLRAVAEVLRTDTGNELAWPYANNTSGKGRRIGESTQVTTRNLTTSKMTLNAYKYTSDAILVPQELIEDSAFDIEAWVGREAGEVIARIQADEFTTADGSAKPKGLITAATLGVTAASATAITTDEVVDLEFSVDPAYRNMPGVGYMAADSTIKVLRKLKDGQNNYIWQTNFRDGTPATINGYPYRQNQSMAAIAASAKVLAFGAYRYFKIRDVRSLRLKRLEERYADYDQIGFIAFLRSDSDLLDAGGHPVKYLQMAAAAGTGTGTGTGS